MSMFIEGSVGSPSGAQVRNRSTEPKWERQRGRLDSRVHPQNGRPTGGSKDDYGSAHTRTHTHPSAERDGRELIDHYRYRDQPGDQSLPDYNSHRHIQ